MKYSSEFWKYHPFVNLIYFLAVIGISIFIMHPVFLCISFACSFIYSVLLNGRQALKFNLLFLLPMMLVVLMINPLFVHEGATIITYFYNGNPLTLESIIYGAASSFMFVTVIMWFSCYNAVMSSDKFIYIFGRIIPCMSLILSMVMRFVPKYKSQIKVISNSQKCVGYDITAGNLITRAKNGLKILSIMLTWALENGVDTADSMKARGYGLKGRTSYSNYRFDNRDKIITAFISILLSIVLFGITKGYTYIRFYPTVKAADFTLDSTAVYVSYAMLCFIPIIIDIREDIKWKYLKYQD
ncbi:MAG: energy-coupling factor transporter transmembrane component T [Tissierellia bacterium]|nr:energy-coupling factor transporter transmembrane component T [Tissierellia bacterium]